MSHVLVLGNGPAAHRLVERLHHHGHDGAITVLGAESAPAYNRVLLSSVLGGTLSPDAVRLPALPEHVGVHVGVQATSIDRARRVVHTNNDVSHRYDTLVLATGAQPRIPNVPGLTSGENVTTLRTLADCARIAGWTTTSRKVAVLGGGVLGVEAARGLADAGNDVTLVHPQPHLMDRQIDHTGGRLLADHLRALGVELRLGRRAAEHQPGKLVLDDGDIVEADGVVVCTGVTPETGLALAAGLTVRHGVVVDDLLRTDDPHVHAIGDCAEHDGETPGLVTPAWEQAEVLARILTGSDAHYHGTSAVTRPQVRGIDLASLGGTAGLDSPLADTELVTLSDPTRGRYAKLALRDHRVEGAVLIGFGHAIASLTQLHDRGHPVPSDRLGLLLGTAASTERAAPAELPGDAVICRCNNVTKNELTEAWHRGARTLDDLAQATRATTGCGSCTDDVRRVCGALKPSAGPELTEQEGAA
jgi:assimilatory nitrate reductase electron transfer subunit